VWRALGEPLDDRPLVVGVSVGVEQTDGDGFDVGREDLVDHAVEVVRVERRDDIAVGVDPLFDTEPVPSRDQRRRPVVAGRVQQLRPAVPLADLEDVAESGRRDDSGLRARPLDQGVDRDRAPVVEPGHVARVGSGGLADCVDPGGEAADEVGRARRLDRVDAVVADQNRVGKRAANVDSYRTHVVGYRHGPNK
jgi:hypothetical protein